MGKSEKYLAACIHRIATKRIHTPVRTPFLTLHHPPTIEDNTLPNEEVLFLQKSTQFDSLPSDLLHNIEIWHACIVDCNKLKPVSAQLTQHNPVLCVSKSYKLKYSPFDLFMYFNFIQY